MHSVSVACCRNGLDCSHSRSHDSLLACLHDMDDMRCNIDLTDLLDISTSEDIVSVVDVVDDLDFMHG